jgi:hypothetical protein
MWVDKKAVIPTKIECYAATGLLIKTLYFKEIKAFEGVLRPSVIETDSPLYKGYRSIIAYANVKSASLPTKFSHWNFSARSKPSGERCGDTIKA